MKRTEKENVMRMLTVRNLLRRLKSCCPGNPLGGAGVANFPIQVSSLRRKGPSFPLSKKIEATFFRVSSSQCSSARTFIVLLGDRLDAFSLQFSIETRNRNVSLQFSSVFALSKTFRFASELFFVVFSGVVVVVV